MTIKKLRWKYWYDWKYKTW